MGNHCLLVFTGDHIILGFLRWCLRGFRPSTVWCPFGRCQFLVGYTFGYSKSIALTRFGALQFESPASEKGYHNDWGCLLLPCYMDPGRGPVPLKGRGSKPGWEGALRLEGVLWTSGCNGCHWGNVVNFFSLCA